MRKQEENCKVNYLYNLCFRSNEVKSDLRKHHFDFGKAVNPMMTTA